MALAYPGFAVPQGYEQNPDIIGRFAQGFDLSQKIGNERDAQRTLGDYVKSLYMGGETAPAQPDKITALVNGSHAAATAATDPTLDSYFKAIRAAESGGNDAARNPNSTATGRYQFLEGTWNGLMQTHPELGLTPEGRNDPTQQERAIRAFTSDNIKALRGKGIGINPGNLYAAHVLGAGGASGVIGQDDATPLATVLSPDVIQANPNLASMTVGDFKQWAANKAGNGQGGYQAPMAPQDAGSPSGAPLTSTASSAGNGLPPRDVMMALMRNPETRAFGAQLIQAAQGGKATDDMREYAYARAQGYQGSFADWQTSKTKGTTVNVNSGSDDFYTAADKKRGEDFVATEVAGTQAASKLTQLGRLEQLLSTPGTQGVEGAWKSLAGQFGINSEGLDDIQAAQALINSMVPDQRQPGSGTMSDADLALFKASIPQIINQPGGNALIIQTLRGIATYDQEIGRIATQVLDRELTPAQGRAAMAQVTNPLEAFRTKEQRTADTVPEGVDPQLWELMLPEERAAWQ
ncbi:MAG: flgJ [Thermomicrobiales bacterium]|jgi:hypothetical protein|nr:flgJ [Thermomicrobiales bacterium]